MADTVRLPIIKEDKPKELSHVEVHSSTSSLRVEELAEKTCRVTMRNNDKVSISIILDKEMLTHINNIINK